MIIKITPDMEKVRSILSMAENTEKCIKEIIIKVGIGENQSVLVREYYEIIRELASAVLLSKGFKAVGENAHKETIDCLSNLKEFSSSEIFEMQELRIRRNNNSYEGKPIKSPYFENKREKFESIISKLKNIIKKNLK
jgi:hypothetical protein